MKFFPTTVPLVVISPMCSINTASTTGAIIDMAPISNFGIVNAGIANQPALTIVLLSKTPICQDKAYPTNTAIIIASCLKKPFPKNVIDKAVARVITANMKLLDAIEKATGIRFNPITIIIGPITCEGKKSFTFCTPIAETINDISTYINPATTIPP